MVDFLLSHGVDTELATVSFEKTFCFFIKLFLKAVVKPINILQKRRTETFKGRWGQKFLSSYLKETPKQYIEVYYRIFISALFGELF